MKEDYKKIIWVVFGMFLIIPMYEFGSIFIIFVLYFIIMGVHFERNNLIVYNHIKKRNTKKFKY